MGRIAEGEAALDAGVAAIGLAVLVGDHAHQLFAAHLGLEGAADPAIGAGGDDRVLGRADLDDGLLVERGRRTGLHAGAAGDAFGREEGLVLACGHPRAEAAARNCQGQRALHFVTGAHAARADDALGLLIGEIGVGLVLALVDVVLAVVAVADVAQAHRTGHVLQLAIAIGRAGQAVQRVVGDVELHHALAQLGQLGRLGMDHHPRRHRRGAGGRGSGAAVDLHQAQPAGAEGFHHVGGAELGDLGADLHGRAHDRRPGRDRHGLSVDGQAHRRLGAGGRGAVVDFLDQGHLRCPALESARPGESRDPGFFCSPRAHR